jgi:hypothetical protein
MKTKTPVQRFFENMEAGLKRYEKEKLSQKNKKALASRKTKSECNNKVVYIRHSKQAK